MDSDVDHAAEYAASLPEDARARAVPREVFMTHVNSGGSVFVKTIEYFTEQGGFRSDWGLSWKPIIASSIETARWLAIETELHAESAPRPYDLQAGAELSEEDRMWLRGMGHVKGLF